MNIKTKFNVGQTVYCIVDNPFTGNSALDAGPFLVTGIAINVSGDDNISIAYAVSPKMHPSLGDIAVIEENVFNSFVDAQKAYVK